ncbi:hypothetical protein FQA39_LY09112 [Lamprigera yunnana]|nr:hypothetical protein FQA39_LY09112 [Lamprigera yunnana]
MLNHTTGLDAVSSSGAQQSQHILDAITAFLNERTAPIPKFSGHIMEDPEEFLRDLEGYFNAHAVPKWQRLKTAATALTEDAAAWWKTYQYFAESYEDFEEMLLDNYDSKEVWDQLSAQLGRRNKSTTETMAEFLEQKGVLARRLKLDDELHLPQLVDMFGPAVLPYLQASQPMPPTNETREEKIVLPEDNIEVNDIGEMDEEAESHANSEGDELVAATEELEILGNDADAEVDVVRDKEINIDPEEDETVEEEIVNEVILDKVASVIVGQHLEPLDHAVPVVLGDLHTHGGKQCPREEVHAQSGTQEASKQNAPRRKGESDALFNRPRHHSTDTKAYALRTSDVENGKTLMMANTEDNTWRVDIYTQLQYRNRNHTEFFQDLIASHNKLFDNTDTLRNENLQLSLLNEKLRLETNVGTSLGSSPIDTRLSEKIQFLEQKLLIQQEELTELHRRKGENAQQIIDLNVKLQEKEKMLTIKEVSLVDNIASVTSLRAEIHMYENNIKELQNLNQTIRDEHQALQLAFASLEDKLRKIQEENRQLLDRLIHYKTKDAEKMNEENDNFLNDGSRHQPIFGSFRLFRKKHAKVQKELEDACKDVKAVNMDDLEEGAGPLFTSTLPSKVTVKFDAHEGEVNAVKWGPDQHLVATGGADRKVQLWDISKGSYKNRGVLVGSNAAVMSLDFDGTGTLLLGVSNDFASRVWSIADQRLRVSENCTFLLQLKK